MDSRDILMDLQATIDNFKRPWAAFVGLVELRASSYVDRESIYGLNLATFPFWTLLKTDDPQFVVVMHPDSVPTARTLMAQRTGQQLSDLELAAALYYLIRTRRS